MNYIKAVHHDEGIQTGFLNKGMKLARDKDIATAEDIINQMVSEGWELQQIACPGDWAGARVGVFYREKNG